MKKILIYFCVAVVVLVCLAPVSTAGRGLTNPLFAYASTVKSVVYHFPDPWLTNHIPYFATENSIVMLRAFVPNDPTITGQLTASGSNYQINATISDKITYYLEYDFDYGRLYYTVYNGYNVDIVVTQTRYNTAGQVGVSNTWTIPANGYRRSYTTISLGQSGFGSAGFVLSDLFQGLAQLQISFANDIDYTSDFNRVETLLDNLNTVLLNIYTQDQSHYTLIEDFIDNFFSETPSARLNNWAYYVSRFENASTNLFNFARDFNSWYTEQYYPLTTETNDLLNQILNALLTYDIEQPTIEDDMSAADEVHSVIDSLTPTDGSGNKIDTAEQVESELDRANMQIEELREGVGTLNDTMEGFLFLDPLFYVPLLVGLALGLVITILGKNKSG